MKIHICAKDFRSYPAIDFTIPDGLSLIEGDNLDAAGHNMVGKTTLLDSWAWCRYGWLPRWGGPKGGAADSVKRRKAGEYVKKCWVEVTETHGSQEIKIRRERPNKLTVWVNGKEESIANQDELDALLGMSAERFLICCYIKQKRTKSFFTMTDGDRTKLLSVIANLEQIEKGLEIYKQKRDLADTRIQVAQGKISVIEERLQVLPAKILECQTEVDNWQDMINASKSNIDILLKNLEEAKAAGIDEQVVVEKVAPHKIKIAELKELEAIKANEITVLRSEYEKSVQEVEPEYLAAMTTASQALKDAEVHNQKSYEIRLSNQRYRELSEQEARKGLAAQEGKCNSCKQDLPQDIKQKTIESCIHKAQEYESLIKEELPQHSLESLKEEKRKAEEAYYSRQAALRTLPVKIEGQISDKRLELSNIQQSIKAEEASIDSIIRGEENRFNVLVQTAQSVYSQAVQELKSNEQIHQHKITSLNNAKKEIDDANRSLTQYKQEEKTASDDKDLALDMVEFFGPKGYRTVCFDELIQRISDRAAQCVSIMTDGLYSTRLDQIGKDSKGNEKLQLRPVVLKGGQEIFSDDLSGGAEDRFAFAYDIAVSEAAGDRMPLLLDEVFSAMDDVAKAEAMQLLEEVAKSRPVLVIDHATEFKAQFQNTIKLVYQDEETSFAAVS